MFQIYIALVRENPDILDINECASKIISFGLNQQLKREACEFLIKHFDQITSEIQDSILNEIETLTYPDMKSDAPDAEIFLATRKQEWLYAVKGSKNKRAQQLYENKFKITQSRINYLGYVGDVGSVNRFNVVESPWQLEDFDKASTDEIIQN